MNSQVAEALRKLYLEKRTGVLLGEGEETKRSIMVRAGSLVGARSSLMDDRLGEVMIRRGKISRRQSEEAAKHIKSGLKLGEILVKLGYIEASDIDEMVRVQLVDIVCDLLLWPPARMVFTDMESVDAIVGQPPVSVADVIMEATRRSAQVAPCLKALLALEKPLQLAQDPAFRSQEVQLTPEKGYIASRIDGHETAKSIVNVSPPFRDRDGPHVARAHGGGHRRGPGQTSRAGPRIDQLRGVDPGARDHRDSAPVAR